MYELAVRANVGELKGTVIFFPGRGGKAQTLIDHYDMFAGLQHSLFLGIGPEDEWYPMPNGANDQSKAVQGLEGSILRLKHFIDILKLTYNFVPEQTALVGFSAGAVMALQLALNFDENYAAVVCHSGAILQPQNVRTKTKDTTFFLLHSQDDDCFYWNERYVPMKNALSDNGYNTLKVERRSGGHHVFSDDISFVSKSLERKFGYDPNQKTTALLSEVIRETELPKWLKTPNAGLNYRIPADMIEQGDIEPIMKMLHSLRSGESF
jgi:predicted esterase